MFIINNKKGVLNMNKMKKIGLSALAGSLVAFSANAADMSISGQANVYMTNGAKMQRQLCLWITTLCSVVLQN